jgi:hypothetical protein
LNLIGTKSQFVEINNTINPATIANINGITFACWFKLSTSTASYSRILDFGDNATGTNPSTSVYIARNSSANTLVFNITSLGTSTTHTTSTSYVDNLWHHVMWSISASGTWTIYIDNNLITLNTVGTYPRVIASATNTNTWTKRYIGRSSIDSPSIIYTTGYIDDFRIYNRVLTSDDILNIYSLGIYTNSKSDITESIDNPTVWYKFDNDVSNMLIDHSGNSYNLTNFSTTHSTTVYKVGYGSASFTGSSSQYLTMSSQINPYTLSNTYGITFATWFNMTKQQVGLNAKLFEFADGTNPVNWITVSASDTSNVYTMYFEIGNSSVSTKFRTTTAYMDNNWHHLVWSISPSGEWNIYIDNILIAVRTDIDSVAIPNATWSSRYIGRSAFTSHNYFTGYIDDFRIYNKVITALDVSYLYNSASLSMPTLEEYPPIAFTTKNIVGAVNNTTNTFNLSSLLYGNGTYVVSASSVSSASYPVMKAFTKSSATGDYWESAQTYTNINGTYTGTVITKINYNDDVSYYGGEWIQIQLPYSIILSSYTISTQTNATLAACLEGPKRFILVGSANNVDWYLVDSRMNITNWNTSGTQNTFTLPNNTTSYVYYRLCIGAIQGNNISYQNVSISQLTLSGNKLQSFPLIKIKDTTLDSYTNTNVYYWNGDNSILYDDVMLLYDNGVNIQTLLNTFHSKRACSFHMVLKTKDNTKKSQIFYIGNNNGQLISIYTDAEKQSLVFQVGSNSITTVINNNTNYIVQCIFSYAYDVNAGDITNLKIYLNNILKSQENFTGYNDLFLDVDKNELILYLGDSSPLYLRDFRIFSSVLSDFEIQSLQTGNTVYTYSPNMISEYYQYKRWNDSSSYYDNTNDSKYITYTDGNVGIGTTNPGSYKLNVNGDSYINGELHVTNEIVAFYSDERLKTVVGNINEPLDIVNSISCFKYKSNDLAKQFGYNGSETHIGVSAQQVQKVLPEVVSLAAFDTIHDETGHVVSKSGQNYLSVKYDKIVPVLIEAIKELAHRNYDNTLEIEKLKNMINTQKQ